MKARKRARESAPRAAQAAPTAPIPVFLIVGVAVGLVAAILAVYWQTFHYGFVAYDDDQYVYENPIVKGGLTAASVAWAFTTFFYANWHPLTWLSYLTDSQMFGINAGAFHVVNVLLHAGAAVFLFLALYRMTRRFWCCAFVAAIFAVHPLHVESVAWVSERKDVLSTFLEMLALLLYARYAESQTVRRYLAVAAVFALALMAKPMLVTFPLVLLLLDYWPLSRFGWPLNWQKMRPAVVEKVPLLALSAIASVLTFAAQRDYGAVVALQHLPLTARLGNAAIGYAAYIGSAIWPENLVVLYPGVMPSPGSVLLAVVLLLAITVAVLRYAVPRPYLLTGWLWYLGMLVPVIGIIQVGVQSRADRYMYVPIVGLSVMVIWLAGDWLETRPAIRPAAAAICGVLLLAYTVAAYRQAGYWSDSRTLFEHTIAVTDGNYIIRNNLGVVFAMDSKFSEAETLYRQALAINSEYADGHANLGHVLFKKGDTNGAADQLFEALRLKPDIPAAKADLALVMVMRGDYAQAARYLTESLARTPDNAVNQSNLCFILLHLGNAAGAIERCQQALRIDPNLADGHFNLGNVWVAQGRIDDAKSEFTRALAIAPGHTAAREALAAISH